MTYYYDVRPVATVRGGGGTKRSIFLEDNDFVSIYWEKSVSII